MCARTTQSGTQSVAASWLIGSNVAASPEAAALKKIYGPHVYEDVSVAMEAITDAIATFEKSQVFRPFNSRYDRYLKGLAPLSAAELRELALFNGKAGCNSCHPSSPCSHGEPPLFTDFSYDNLGLPKNLLNRFYADPPSINPDGAAST